MDVVQEAPFLPHEVVRNHVVPRLIDLDSFVNWSKSCHHYHKSLSIQFPPQLSDQVWRREGPRLIVEKGGDVRLTAPQFIVLCAKAQELLMEEPNNLCLNGPITVVGDIHGQFHDLVKMFSLNPPAPSTSYLFLGDYVNRGYYSAKVFVYLLALKICYPQHIYLLRGNHEDSGICMTYGFYDELMYYFGFAAPFKAACEIFGYLPLTAVINNRIFCVHGGLSPLVSTVDNIYTLDRRAAMYGTSSLSPQLLHASLCPSLIPSVSMLVVDSSRSQYEGPVTDLLWSDPEESIDDWQLVPKGGQGWLFGKSVVAKWNHRNGLKQILRAHQLNMEGYQWFVHPPDFVSSPPFTPDVSAPNYCGRCGNTAAILNVAADSQITAMTYEATEAPEEETQFAQRGRKQLYFL